MSWRYDPVQFEMLLGVVTDFPVPFLCWCFSSHVKIYESETPKQGFFATFLNTTTTPLRGEKIIPDSEADLHDQRPAT